MRSVVLMHFLSAAFMLTGESLTVAQDKSLTVVVAIDQPTADLWKMHYPKSKLEVLVRSDDEAYDTINRRASSLRDATHVLFRGDRCSVVSQFFRERISNQGAESIDLVEQFHVRDRVRQRKGDPKTVPGLFSVARVRILVADYLRLAAWDDQNALTKRAVSTAP